MDVALENAVGAEENIISAEADQKTAGKCMFYIWILLASVAVAVIIIVVILLIP